MVIQFCGVELPLAELRKQNILYVCNTQWCIFRRTRTHMLPLMWYPHMGYTYSATTGWRSHRSSHILQFNDGRKKKKEKRFASQHTFWYETQILNIIFDEDKKKKYGVSAVFSSLLRKIRDVTESSHPKNPNYVSKSLNSLEWTIHSHSPSEFKRGKTRTLGWWLIDAWRQHIYTLHRNDLQKLVPYTALIW